MVTGTLCFVFAAVLALGQAVAARHQAGGAADLAALAAADTVLRGPAAACAAAARVAEAQRTELVRCTVHGEVADVTARARFGPCTADVRARAGPADPEAQAVPVPAARAPTGPNVQDIRPRTGGRAPPEAGDCAALPDPGTASGQGGTGPRGPGTASGGAGSRPPASATASDGGGGTAPPVSATASGRNRNAPPVSWTRVRWGRRRAACPGHLTRVKGAPPRRPDTPSGGTGSAAPVPGPQGCGRCLGRAFG
ncbi:MULTISPECIES: Rv3654c family TadE-like protein [unclassified Streptomyces]|uniref:Rv3654c family TadE-like protein n=1 Tax=unclassified Streptomyces TaxID=2593676 RepID=UPI0009A12E20|nr:Rv3654c family TadE-like protein [Streptomyces sp. C8S0]